jgi:hypothetical protein
MTREYDDLTALTDAVYRSKHAELEPVLAQERQLRRALADLDKEIRDNTRLPTDDLTDLQRLGGDMAWRGWVAQSRADLQMRLAQVLAVKAGKMADLRKAFGKAEAVAILKKKQAEDQKAAREKARLEEVQALIRLTMTP